MLGPRKYRKVLDDERSRYPAGRFHVCHRLLVAVGFGLLLAVGMGKLVLDAAVGLGRANFTSELSLEELVFLRSQRRRIFFAQHVGTDKSN